MAENGAQTPGWWSTLPGLITGLAGLITAIGGLIVILSSNGLLKTKKDTPAENSAPEKTVSPVSSVDKASPQMSVPGRFPLASERLLTSDDMLSIKKEDLKIMRNEIYARHGLIFKTQDMKSYFGSQSWYSPQHDDVTSLLTNTEIKNIALIKSYE